jgi:hypothetical protein
MAQGSDAGGSAIASSGKLAFLIPDLYGPLGLALENPDHEAHFNSAFQGNFGPFNAALGSQLSSLQIPSPASGFTYTFNPALGIYVPSARSFGPILAERAETIGKGRFYAGFSHQHFSFDNIDGLSLRSLPTVFEHQPTTNVNYRRDFISTNNFVDMQISQLTVFLTYGLTDSLDFSFAFPSMSASMTVVSDATIRRMGTQGDPELPHTFRLGADQISQKFSASGSAQGIGDIVVRLKGTIYRSGRVVLGEGVDLRLPTGDEYDFLGSGAAGIKPFFVASFNFERFAPHANLAFQWNSSSVLAGDLATNTRRRLPSQLEYALGADVTITPKFTLAVDLLSRNVFNANRVTTRPFVNFEGTEFPAFQQLHFAQRNAYQLDGSIGFKANAIGRLLVTGNVLFRLNRAGLRDRVVPLIGLSYTL